MGLLWYGLVVAFLIFLAILFTVNIDMVRRHKEDITISSEAVSGFKQKTINTSLLKEVVTMLERRESEYTEMLLGQPDIADPSMR